VEGCNTGARTGGRPPNSAQQRVQAHVVTKMIDGMARWGKMIDGMARWGKMIDGVALWGAHLGVDGGPGAPLCGAVGKTRGQQDAAVHVGPQGATHVLHRG
jgi:hypothetical protein